MLNVEQRFMIKDLYRQGVSISKIARQTGHDRKTIRAVLKEPLTPMRKAPQPKVRKVDAYAPYLQQRIEADVLNAQKLYQEIVALGYTGKDRQVRAFVAPYRQGRRQVATLRFETEPGQQAQVDWGAFGMTNHQGRRCRLYAFVMTLGWPRAMYVEFTISMDIVWWLRCHLHAFHYFGGVPQEILHDNLKTAVLSRSAEGVIHWHPRYLDFAHYYGVRPQACRSLRLCSVRHYAERRPGSRRGVGCTLRRCGCNLVAGNIDPWTPLTPGHVSARFVVLGREDEAWVDARLRQPPPKGQVSVEKGI